MMQILSQNELREFYASLQWGENDDDATASVTYINKLFGPKAHYGRKKREKEYTTH